MATTALKKYDLYIDGSAEEPRSGTYLPSIDPANGELLYEVADAGAEDVDRAVRAARKAFEDPAWRWMTPSERGRLLRRIGDGMAALRDGLAELETRDNGKLIRETRFQHLTLPGMWEYFAGWPDKLRGGLVPLGPRVHDYVAREPVGAVVVIVPWNSPLQMASAALAPALSAGNTVVLKPSEHTSASALEFMRVLEEAGVPNGVVNIVTGLGSTAGEALVTHPEVDFITFTGGTETGRRVAANAASRLTPVILELGGKSPNIIFEDADLDNAAVGILSSIFAACGQTCVAGSRCFLHRDVYDDVLERVVARVEQIKLGNPMDDDTDMGPLAFEQHMRRVLGHIARAREEGATVRIGGDRSSDTALANGFYVEPTILENVENDMRVAREEIFGPVLGVIPFESEDEVVRLANDTDFGLAAGIWTRNLSRAHRVASKLNAGNVWVNTYRSMSPAVPFGGFGASGYGKQGGEEIMLAYTRAKNVWIDISDDRVPDPFIMRG